MSHRENPEKTPPGAKPVGKVPTDIKGKKMPTKKVIMDKES